MYIKKPHTNKSSLRISEMYSDFRQNQESSKKKSITPLVATYAYLLPKFIDR
jgi:hypothetical protein